MRTELVLDGGSGPGSKYLSWAPVRGEVQLADPGTATTPVAVRLRNRDATQGGQVVFLPVAGGPPADELQLDLPLDGSPVAFAAAGKFGQPSAADGDAGVDVVTAGDGTLLSSTSLMVRVRKDADTLSVAERGRFVSALAALNDRGLGRFSDFRNMHLSSTRLEAHGRAGFLPWHRAYLLDLERELQAIDSSVTLPYWRFDRPAPNLFSLDFLGVPDQVGTLRFSSTNPLQFWVTDQSPGIVRAPFFDTAVDPPGVLEEADTLLLGGAGHELGLFTNLEGDPHGSAHTSFEGFIDSIGTAAKDPLFFLLHANVDRLWAKWQWLFHRFDTSSAATFPFLGSATSPGATRIGHNLLDTMWPWNQDINPPRPSIAPGGGFPPSPTVGAPGTTPRVGDMVDYQGALGTGSRLGFDYDDVPFS